MTTALLPWQAEAWQRLEVRIAAGELPHGLLISGPRHAGKSRFVRSLAQRLLCAAPADGMACGQCRQCLLLKAGTHPDLLETSPEESAQIKVDQVRDLSAWAAQTAQQGGYKVNVISPADALNMQASNALLKTLEEPPPGTLICLVTDQPGRLLPTIVSRCQRIECRVPRSEEALAWLSREIPDRDDLPLLLDIAAGIPLRVLELIDDDYLNLRRSLVDALMPLASGSGSPLELAAGLVRADPIQVLDVLYELIADSLGATFSGGQVMRNTDVIPELTAWAARVPAARRFDLLDRVCAAKRAVRSTSNPNLQMLLEDVFDGLMPESAAL